MSSETTIPTTGSRRVLRTQRVVVRFAGDSGDGMQLTGGQFTSTSASMGNDVATLPDFPAEIRAPAGTLPGVSGFQIQFASEEVFTPGDQPDVLVAMNPAALKVNIGDLAPNGILIVNADAFKSNDLRKAAYESNPLEDGSLDGYQVYQIELTRLTRAALSDVELPPQSIDRCKNFFALGLMYWLYNRPLDVTLDWIRAKFAGKPLLIEANEKALRGGFAYGEAAELFPSSYEVPAARLDPGTYRNVSGNQALALGFVAAGQKSGHGLFLGSYPITPASDLLHELARYKNFGVTTFQAEDEIAAIGAAVGASFAGSLAITSTSGPGMALKSEFLGLAIMVELPLVVVDVQRAGPSTGMPTKTEQADLLMALYGRFAETPCFVLAARSPADCFETAYEACRLAVTHMTPVIVLSDGFIANGAEPWRLPDVDALARFATRALPPGDAFLPYGRDPDTLARPWAVPGTPGHEHRIGGLEKSEGSGNVSYDPDNHERMVRLRAEKIARAAQHIPEAVAEGDPDGVLVIGWGSTYGAITSAVQRVRSEGRRVAQVHLRHLNPLPRNIEDLLKRYRRGLVPEINLGQLSFVLQGRFLRRVDPLCKVRGQPFRAAEIYERIVQLTDEEAP